MEEKKNSDYNERGEERRSSRQHLVIVTDTDFADDIALMSEEIEQAQEMMVGPAWRLKLVRYD